MGFTLETEEDNPYPFLICTTRGQTAGRKADEDKLEEKTAL
jgi:hypothetical protein